MILKAFDQFMPEMREAWEKSGGKVELAYPRMTATSIDYWDHGEGQERGDFPSRLRLG